MRKPLGVVTYHLALIALAVTLSVSLSAQPAANKAPVRSAAGGGGGGEARAARAYDAAAKEGASDMHAFLAEFPKGADLHVHLSGAIYAETFIRDAGEDGLCVDTAVLKFMKPPCAAPLVPASRLSGFLSSADQDLEYWL